MNPERAQIATLAPRLSDGLDEGHVYWFHSVLHQSFQGSSDAHHLTIGPTENAPSWSVGCLSVSAKQRDTMSHFPWIGMGRDVSNCERELNLAFDRRKPIHLHVYDGGFREFILVSRLLKRNPGWTSSFNFANWLDPWDRFFRPNGVIKKFFVRNSSKRMFSDMRIRPYTEALSLGATYPEPHSRPKRYPLFSSLGTMGLEDGTSSSSQSRDIDVIFFPETSEELGFSIDVLKGVRARSSREVRAAVQPRWGLRISSDLASELNENGVLIFQGNLSLKDYASMFLRSKVVVLPYRRTSHYRFQGSGRLLDAIVAGANLVTPSGTALQEHDYIIPKMRSATMWDADQVSSMVLELFGYDNFVQGSMFNPKKTVSTVTSDAIELRQLPVSKKVYFRALDSFIVGSFYLTLNWYQPFLALSKLLGISNQSLMKLKSRLS